MVRVFERHSEEIDSESHGKQESNEVLRKLRTDLQLLSFKVEEGKKKGQTIPVPVLFGRQGQPVKSFGADAYHEEEGFVLEVEAGRAVSNYQFLKDIFEASMMHDVNYLAVAVRNNYRGKKDYEKVKQFMDTLYASSRLKLPLKGLVIIGY